MAKDVNKGAGVGEQLQRRPLIQLGVAMAARPMNDGWSVYVARAVCCHTFCACKIRINQVAAKMDLADDEDISCSDFKSMLLNADEMKLYLKKLKDSCNNFDVKTERNIVQSISKSSGNRNTPGFVHLFSNLMI